MGVKVLNIKRNYSNTFFCSWIVNFYIWDFFKLRQRKSVRLRESTETALALANAAAGGKNTGAIQARESYHRTAMPPSVVARRCPEWGVPRESAASCKRLRRPSTHDASLRPSFFPDLEAILAGNSWLFRP